MLRYILAATAGLLLGAGFSGYSDEAWHITRIIPGFIMGFAMMVGLLRQTPTMLKWSIIGSLPLFFALVILELRSPSSTGLPFVIGWTSILILNLMLFQMLIRSESTSSEGQPEP